MKIWLEKPALNNFKVMSGKTERPRWGFEVRNFSYTYSVFKGNYHMESKMIEYGIIFYINTS